MDAVNEMTVTEKARLARNAYYREWRRKNPERNKAIQERYWVRKVERMKESSGGANA